MPGGITMNGEEIRLEGQREVDELEGKMISTYEIPPMDMIG